MSDLPLAQRTRLESWASQAIDAEWLPRQALESLDTVTTATPDQLFQNEERPLVAGLFGGTGVGKSTLLNRLAGETVARASAERPTSREITVYAHRELSIERLPAIFPMQSMRTARHDNERFRHVLFIDMPDFDSVETANRDLVDQWLPHLDVVVYVVSPERYRDDQGWRLLLRHAREHAWLFVMNHWDRGDPVQLDDFREQLRGAGLTEPVILRSDSSQLSRADSASESSIEDDFDTLTRTLSDLSDQAIVKSLGELGILARLRSLKSVGDQWLERVADERRLKAVQTDWPSHWQQAEETISTALAHRARQLADAQEQPDRSWLARLAGSDPVAVTPGQFSAPLIDDAALARLDTLLEEFLNRHARTSDIPLAALSRAVATPYARARQAIAVQVEEAMQRSLLLPGHPLQRGFHSLLGWLALLLPLAAMGWIGWRVINGFIEGGSNPAAYLGSSFAINSMLMLAIAWALPAFLHRKSRPSAARAALRGINQGLTSALDQTGQAVAAGFADLERQALTLRRQYQSLWDNLGLAGEHTNDSVSVPDAVRRMLASEINQTDQRLLDVRANTQSSTESAPVS